MAPKQKKPTNIVEAMQCLPPLPPPPEPPEGLTAEGAECWRALTSRMKDWCEGDLPVLKMAVHWHETFLKAAKDAQAATDPGDQWKFQTCQAMASKQFTQLIRCLGLAKTFRTVPSKLDRAKAFLQANGE